MYNHVIWDFDGTLFNTYPVMADVFKDLLKENGFEEPIDEILKYMKVSMYHTIEHYKQKYQINDEFLEKYNTTRKEKEILLSQPYNGIEKICEYIHDSGKKNYVYTHRGESTFLLLKKYNLYDYFTEIIISKNGFKRKPSPDAINYLIQKYNILRDEAIMIGDRDLDIFSAKNAGIDSCLFNEYNEKLIDATFLIKNFEELYSII